MLSLVGTGRAFETCGITEDSSIDAVFTSCTARGLPGAGQVSVLQKLPDLCGKAAQRCFQALEGLAKCFQLQGAPQSAAVA